MKLNLGFKKRNTNKFFDIMPKYYVSLKTIFIIADNIYL